MKCLVLVAVLLGVLLARPAFASNCVGHGLDPDYLKTLTIHECNPDEATCTTRTDELTVDPQFSASGRLYYVRLPQTLSRIFITVSFEEPAATRNPVCVVTAGSAGATFSNANLSPAAATSIFTGTGIGPNNVNTWILTCNTPGIVPPCEQTIYQIRMERWAIPCPAQGNPNNLITDLTVHLGLSASAPKAFLTPDPFNPNTRVISYPPGITSDFKFKEVWVNVTLAANLDPQWDPIATITGGLLPQPVVLNNLVPLAVGVNTFTIRVDAPPYCAMQRYTLTLTRAAPVCPVPNNAVMNSMVLTIPGAPFGVERVQVNPGFQGIPGTYAGLVGSNNAQVQYAIGFDSRLINPVFFVNGKEWFIAQDNTTMRTASITQDITLAQPATNNVVMVVGSDNCANGTYTVQITRRINPLWDPDTLPAPNPIPNPQTTAVSVVDGTLPSKKRHATDQEIIRALIANALDLDVRNVAVNRYSPKVDLTVTLLANGAQSAATVAARLVATGQNVNPNFWQGTLLAGVVWNIRTVTIRGPPVNIQQGPKDTGSSVDSSPSSRYFTIVPTAPVVNSVPDLPTVGDIPSSYFIQSIPQIGVSFFPDDSPTSVSAASLLESSALLLVILASLAMFM